MIVIDQTSKQQQQQQQQQQGESDPEMREMIRAELKEIITTQKELEDKIIVLLLPRDPNDDRNIMLEIRLLLFYFYF